MSTCVMNRMKDGGTAARLLSAFGITDEGFAIFTTAEREKCTVAYLLGLVVVTYASWNVGTFIGAVASGLLPAILSASLGIALYAMFLGLLVPNLTNNWRLGALVVLTALCNTLLGQFMASSWALILSTLLCAFVGVFFVELPEDGGEEADHEAC
jgi:predicted branched-subunit amino acid permease